MLKASLRGPKRCDSRLRTILHPSFHLFFAEPPLASDFIAGISPHSAQKQTVRADTPNHRATAAVDKSGSLRGTMLGKFIAFTPQAGYPNIDSAGPLSEERHNGTGG